MNYLLNTGGVDDETIPCVYHRCVARWFLNDAVPEEHKNGIDMGRDLLRRSRVLVVCGHSVTEAMKNDIAVAQRLGITATTLEGILTVKGQGRC